MQKISWILVAILGLSTGFMVNKFILSGRAEKSEDGRLVIELTANERDFILLEMRAFLDSVQQITQGVASNDFDTVVKAASAAGLASQEEVPGALIAKLPLEFKKLGFDTHAQFTQLALDAEQLGDSEYTMGQLGTLLQNCVTCHAAFKFEVKQPNNLPTN